MTNTAIKTFFPHRPLVHLPEFHPESFNVGKTHQTPPEPGNIRPPGPRSPSRAEPVGDSLLVGSRRAVSGRKVASAGKATGDLGPFTAADCCDAHTTTPIMAAGGERNQTRCNTSQFRWEKERGHEQFS